jgi:glycosyltransferase involved in cell wall biosynthesis
MVNRSSATVVIPTRDRPHLLAVTLRSVLGQCGVDLDVVVVNDGDGAETAALVDAIGDPRVRVVRNDGAPGECGTRNRGLAEAQRDWVAFCDDDDLWAPGKLAAQLSAAVAEGAEWVYAGDVSVDRNLRVLSGSPPPAPDRLMRELRRHNPVPAGSSNVVVRRDALARAGPFDPALSRCGDWDMWLRLARTAGRPACVRRPLVAYRFHPLNVPGDLGRMITEARCLARRYRIHVDLAAMHRRAAWAALRAGRRGQAICHYAGAVARGDVRSLARMAFAAVDSRVGSDAMFRLLQHDPAWVADAELWLASFTRPTIAPSATVAEGGRQ